MGFIGNIPAEKYISLSVQHFTVTATTSYTLDSGVTNENEIALFINNVRQEPGASYAYTATGTTLTLSVATAGTDSMYCLFLGKARETVTPALGSVTDAMLSGSISSAKITSLDAAKLTGSVPSSALTNVDISQLEMNQALLAFKIASSNQLAKFSMVDQVIDEYQDATGIDAGASTNELAGGTTTAKYFEGGTSVTPTATGGTITTDGAYTIHSFTASGNYINNTAQSVEYLVVAGGGGGGSARAGGGAGGGFRFGTGFSMSAATHSVTVGAGGAGGLTSGVAGDYRSGRRGGDSVVSTITSTGGGGGIGEDNTNTGNFTGGSGGGACGGTLLTGGAGNTPSTTPSQGNNGGNALYSGNYPAGGGGGAGSVGGNYSGTSVGGAGGSGASNSITGSAVLYAGGGGGATYNGGTAGAGGSGGGGAAGAGGTTNAGTPGTNGLGGGAGGGAYQLGASAGAVGGSGVVIIRRATTTLSTGANLTLQSVATTAESAPTTADLVVLIEDGAGTATVNTDIKGFVSRNGSAFSTEVTFVDEGDWGTNKRILVARNIDISGIATGTAMKYKLTSHNQSAGSKETRIHATSLAWA